MHLQRQMYTLLLLVQSYQKYWHCFNSQLKDALMAYGFFDNVQVCLKAVLLTSFSPQQHHQQ